jgi:3-methyladenine DNA glycosylase/8-oxoguanine DNA glycosylase
MRGDRVDLGDARLPGSSEWPRRRFAPPLKRSSGAIGHWREPLPGSDRSRTVDAIPTVRSELVRAIVYQQLAGRAAQAIYGRVRAAVGPALTPETLAATTDAALRQAGLSANKLAALRDIAAKVADGTVVLAQTSRRSDEELIERLTTVRGIGRWTAEMYLLF